MQLRQIAPPRVAPVPTGLRIRARLRVSEADAVVLRHLGTHLGRLAGTDLAVRCRLGPDHDKHHWAARKQALTADSSSRWAGAITKRSNDAWATAWQSKTRHAASLRHAYERSSGGLPALSVAKELGGPWPDTAARPRGARSSAVLKC